MLSNRSLPQIPLETIIDRVLAFRQITPLDYQLLKSAILSRDSLTGACQSALHHLLDELHQGIIWISTSDQIA
ncbi:MAG: hypothetical protein WBA13_16035 [Microcoleaceae cyanobacterium]